MNDLTQSRWLPIVLLTCSNVFMTFAWYGHLKHKAAPLWVAILVSWGIAFFEYVLMVPANRWGTRSIPPRSSRSSRKSSRSPCSASSRCFIWANDCTGITSPLCFACWQRWPSRSCRRSDTDCTDWHGGESPSCIRVNPCNPCLSFHCQNSLEMSP